MRWGSFRWATAIGAALLLAGCGGDGTSAEADGPRALSCLPDAGGPPCGAGARVGTDYDYVLWTHCGIQVAVFNGRLWLAVSPPSPERYSNETEGVMRLLSSDRAQFQADSLVAQFTVMPPNVEPPPCA